MIPQIKRVMCRRLEPLLGGKNVRCLGVQMKKSGEREYSDIDL